MKVTRLAPKALIYSLILSFFFLTSFTSGPGSQQDSTGTPRFKVRTIVIDAGHGGKDPGTRGRYSLEKTVALSIALKLRTALAEQMPQLHIVMTRSDDTFIPLNERSNIANEHHANLFISIHCNSSPEGIAYSSHKQKGVMVLVYAIHRQGEQKEAVRENSSISLEKNYKETYQSYDENDPANLIILNAYMQKYRKQSILFGDMLMDQFKEVDHRVCIGVKEQGVFVLARSGMPAVLIETGFINNPEEEDYLNSATGQAEIVDAIVASIKNYKELEDSK
jgi:N-acetylmuramoyl-L-alanine amidase